MTSFRFRPLLALCAMAAMLALAVADADARPGRGGSVGSRGSQTFSAPPSTATSPSARPVERSMTQPGQPGGSVAQRPATSPGGSFFNRPGFMGGGFLGGMFAGFLGAGLLGMMFGHGFGGGLGGFASILGLILQIGLIILVVRLAMLWWQRRNAPAYASTAAGPAPAPGPQANYRSAMGFGLGSSAPPLEIKPEDYEAFERLLGDIQAAWSDEDVAKLERLATPEMASYFARDLADNKARNAVNKVSGVKLLQGDLAESWREGDADYATVAMRFSLVDKTFDRNNGQMIAGSDQPTEVTEVWTFVRHRGGNWELSAIQQTS
jgi:predicted lipid-binding transport protein (Tim44 family)